MNQMSLDDQARHYYQHVGEAADYLLGRGVTGEIAQHALLGYCQDPLPGHDQYVGRIVIPYLTPNGVVDLRFRAIDNSNPKYLSLPGHKPRLYNTVCLANDPPMVGITEGEFDALVATHVVGVPSVAVPGAQAWSSRRHSRVFRGYERVLVFADGDDPGRQLANQIARDVPQAIVVDLGDGLDLNEVYLTSGVDSIRKKAGLATGGDLHVVA